MALTKAVAHPLRVRILTAFTSRELVSGNEFASEFGVSREVVNYHFRRLCDLGFLALARRTPVRGVAVEHHYRLKRRVDAPAGEWETLPSLVKDTIVQARLADINQLAARADAHGAFESASSCLTLRQLDLDPTGWKQLADAIAGSIERIQRIHADARARLGQDPGQPDVTRCVAVLMLFEAHQENSARAAHVTTQPRTNTSRPPGSPVERALANARSSFHAALGLTVRELRREQNLSQQQYAQRCGLAASFVRQIEHCKTDSRLTAIGDLARGLGISRQQLVTHVTAREERLLAERAWKDKP